MSTTSFHILRVGLAVTFIWIGLLILKNPAAWGGYLEPWAIALLPVSLNQALIGTAILDIIIGAFLLADIWVWLTGLVGAVHIIIVLIVSGITDITVRDIGLLAGLLAIMFSALPSSLRQKFIH